MGSNISSLQHCFRVLIKAKQQHALLIHFLTHKYSLNGINNSKNIINVLVIVLLNIVRSNDSIKGYMSKLISTTAFLKPCLNLLLLGRRKFWHCSLDGSSIHISPNLWNFWTPTSSKWYNCLCRVLYSVKFYFWHQLLDKMSNNTEVNRKVQSKHLMHYESSGRM